MNTRDFIDKEELGLVSLVRLTKDSYAINVKRFSADTGDALPDEVVGGNINELTERKAVLLQEIATIDTFIRKFEGLKPQNGEGGK